MNWRILSNAVRNTLTLFGVAATLGFFAGSKIISDVLGTCVVSTAVYACYWFELHFRELRLSKGWYR